MSVDACEALVARLAEISGVDAVAVELPHDFDQHLPVIEVTPGETESVPLYGGPTPMCLEYLNFDVTCYAATQEQARDLGAEVTEHLYAWAHPKISVTTLPPFARRPDFNPAVRRVGALVTLLVRP